MKALLVEEKKPDLAVLIDELEELADGRPQAKKIGKKEFLAVRRGEEQAGVQRVAGGEQAMRGDVSQKERPIEKTGDLITFQLKRFLNQLDESVIVVNDGNALFSFRHNQALLLLPSRNNTGA